MADFTFVTFAPFQTNSQADDAQCIVRALLSRSHKGKIPDMPVASPSGENRAGLGVTAQELISFRVDMLRFARLQLRNAETAEDMVQDAIEAALRGASSFAGQSSLKTWVFAILRNRIIDYIRQAGRTVSMSSLVDDGRRLAGASRNSVQRSGAMERWFATDAMAGTRAIHAKPGVLASIRGMS